MLQIVTRYCRGDLAGAEKRFMSRLKFFDDPGVRRGAGVAEPAFFFASLNAWTLGRADVARERVTQMMAALNESNRYNVACSVCFAARVRFALREYEQAEALAARAVDLLEKNQFGYMAEAARCGLGLTRAQLGRAAEGIALIRKGIAGLIEVGGRQPISECTTFLAAAQERSGAIIEALETVGRRSRRIPTKYHTGPRL